MPERPTGSSHSPDAAMSFTNATFLSEHSQIYVVDDEPLNSEVITAFLSDGGYSECTAFEDPVQALAEINGSPPDLVLLDIHMPKMNGLDVLQAVRASPATGALPVIILTASNDDETRLNALELGATDFLQKPVNQPELLLRIRNVLAAKAHQDLLKRSADELAEAVRIRTAELEASRRDVIHCLARAAEYRDDDTGFHVQRVGRYARIIANELGWTASELDTLEAAAQLHDVGKIGIPDAILLKPGKLTDDEFEYMQKHCGFGKKIISPHSSEHSELIHHHAEIGASILDQLSSPVLEVAQRIALTHHEKWNGKGYPLGLKGEDIPIEGRITAIADVFDALASKRPYKAAFPIEKCFQIIESERGEHFDPECVDAFFKGREQIIASQIALAETE